MSTVDILDKLGFIYSDALIEVIGTVSGIRLKVSSRDADNNFDDITGSMYLNGKKSGMLFVTAKESDVRVLCSYMTGTDLQDVTAAEVDDTMCELVNMTAGNAKLRLTDTDYIFSLLQPFVIKGKSVSIVTKSITKVEAGTLSNGEISIRFKVVY